MTDPLAELDAVDNCWCTSCFAKLDKLQQFYILCPDCGNKRCPKATNHEHACTESNLSGQYGSAYGQACLSHCCDDYRDYLARLRREFNP
jgi:hypothetical protein